jgi:hypothetical protein
MVMNNVPGTALHARVLGSGGVMEDEKKKYTFTDKRGRTEEPGKGAGPESPGRPFEVSSPGEEEAGVVDFPTLIMSFASAAMISMGAVPDPMTGQVNRDLDIAKQNIDIISLLKDKTKGNLTEEEETLLDNILYELRMIFVQAQKG